MVQVNRQSLAEEASAHVAFFQRKWVQSFLPFLTSMAFHLALIVFGYSIYRVAIVMVPHVELQTKAIEADYPVDGPRNPNDVLDKGFFGNNHDRTKQLTQPFETNDVDERSFNVLRGDGLKSNMNPGADTDADNANMIAIGTHTDLTKGPHRIGIGPAGQGRVTKFGPGGGGDENSTPSTVFPTPNPNELHKIVYLCDATGSMNTAFSGLRDELHRAVQNLQVTQSFGVIFFSDDKVINLNQAGLLLATDSNKKKAFDFMGDVTPRGMTNPIPAIRAAFAQQPEMMYVLTDGFDQVDSLESVYNEFATLNKEGKVKVNTILIGTPDQKELVDILKRIANDNHGTMKIVSKSDF